MILDDMMNNVLNKANQTFYGVRNAEEEKIYNKWLQEFEILELTPFYDANFLKEFLNIIPLSMQYKYVENTCKYHMHEECDPNFVIVTRRAVPSKLPKPENFWSTEHRRIVAGLRNELPLNSPSRLHSVIMVTTMGKLQEHGLAYTENGITDGEIAINPNKPFSDFLFMYKPESEIYELSKFLEQGGISRDELLKQLEKNAEERIKRQGFIEVEATHKK